MKRIAVLILLITVAFGAFSFAEDKAKDPNQLFYKANALYEARDYTKAIEVYLEILDSGVESGNLYYNIGNSFFKLGKIGYAILCYDRAKKFMPRDSDMRSNLDYARSLIEDPGLAAMPRNPVTKAIRLPFRAFNMSALTIITALFYILVIALFSVSIWNRVIGRRLKLVTSLCVIIFAFSLAAFSLRFYDEVFRKHGIIIQKSVECKYEPIDKSTTYYKLTEGCEVFILKTKNDWRQIKRADGKIAWVKKDAVEPI
jgi:tetratricopeptide (TPR) repeat protein